MRLALPLLASLLAACALAPGSSVPAASSGAPRRVGAIERESADPASLDAPEGPQARFRLERGGPSAASAHEKSSASKGPLRYGEMSVLLENSGTDASEGVLEVVLPSATFGAELVFDAAATPLVESRVAERNGRTFRSPRLRLSPGEKRTVVVRHAGVALSGGDETASAGGLSFARVSVPNGTAARPRNLTFLLDTSAGRSHQLARQVEVVRALARSLDPSTALRVAAYDIDVEPLFDGKASELDGVVKKLERRGALGVSNAGNAIEWAAAPRSDGSVSDRIVIVTDGIDGFDALDVGAIAQRVRKSGAPDLRIDVLVPNGPHDGAAIRGLARGVGKVAGLAVALDDEAAATRVLLTRANTAVDEPEVVASWPVPLDLAAPGSSVVVATPALAAASADIPSWVTAQLTAPRPPVVAARSWERIAALSTHARPFPSMEEQRADFDPMAELREKQKHDKPEQPETMTVSAAELAPAPAAAAKTALKAPVEEPKPQIPPETIQLIVRRNFPKLRFCFRDAIRKDPKAGGKITIRFDIDETGSVPLARAASTELSPELTKCFVRTFESLSFPQSPSGTVTVNYPLTLAKSDAAGAEDPIPMAGLKMPPGDPSLGMPQKEAWQGAVKVVFESLLRGDSANALEVARGEVRRAPSEALGYLLLGDALAATGDLAAATRAFASLIELDPTSGAAAALAGARLALRDNKGASELGERALTRALELSPDSAAPYRQLAMLEASRGERERALLLLDQGLARAAAKTPGGRELFRKDLGIIAQALVATNKQRSHQLSRWLGDVGASLETESSLLVVADWTDPLANVDVVVRDGALATAQKGTPNLPSGGRILADVSSGGGPEAFALQQVGRTFPYTLSIGLQSGAAPFVAGSLMITEADGNGTLRIETRPFVVNAAGGRMDAGALDGPSAH